MRRIWLWEDQKRVWVRVKVKIRAFSWVLWELLQVNRGRKGDESEALVGANETFSPRTAILDPDFYFDFLSGFDIFGLRQRKLASKRLRAPGNGSWDLSKTMLLFSPHFKHYKKRTNIFWSWITQLEGGISVSISNKGEGRKREGKRSGGVQEQLKGTRQAMRPPPVLRAH